MCAVGSLPFLLFSPSALKKDIAEPVLLPDKGIWHPVADKVFENAAEYLAWYNKVRRSTQKSKEQSTCNTHKSFFYFNVVSILYGVLTYS